MSSWSNPGETIPADGRVIEGESTANEALLTGESAPVRKRPGVPVTGGAVNIESPLLVEVAQVGEGTRLSAIVRLMERAAMEKPRIVELADRIAVVSSSVCCSWRSAWPSPGRSSTPRQALWITVSVLVVSCPCALSLATPVALTVAGGAMARAGLLVTRSHAIETLARATHFVFDKTGTLTTGEMHVLEVLPLGTLGREQSLALAAALEQASEHPIGKALRVAMAGRDMPAVEGLANEPGCGMKAQYGGRQVRVGRPDYVLKLHGRPLPDSAQLLLDGGDTVVALGDDTGWIALFRIGDEPRPEAAAMVAALHAAGSHVALLSGDAAAAARRVAQALGIDEVHADASPQAKHAYVRHLQAGGAVVAMVGDGVNDAPVLAQAQVSVAMGGGGAAGTHSGRSGAALRRPAASVAWRRRRAPDPAGDPPEPVVVLCLQPGRPAPGDDGFHRALDGRHRHVR
jgi:Cu2+-exporting ATPase